LIIRALSRPFLVGLALVSPLAAQAADPAPPVGTKGRLLFVHDGDTFDATYPDGRRIKTRLSNADTPETGNPGTVNAAKCPEELEAGKRATSYVAQLIRSHEVVAISLGRYDKFNRVLATVLVTPAVDGHTDLGALLVYQGLGRFYRGERRMTWCPEH